MEQLLTYAGEDRIEAADVLSVLGVADAEQLFEAIDAVVAGDGAGSLRAAARLTASGRDPGQILRDLEVHGRELLIAQMLDAVPDELAVTPERDERLLAQARSLAGTDAVRLLGLVSAALEATANGAQARIQLELVLVRAAAPEVDPSAAALLARIERLERGGVTARRAPPAAPAEPLGAERVHFENTNPDPAPMRVAPEPARAGEVHPSSTNPAPATADVPAHDPADAPATAHDPVPAHDPAPAPATAHDPVPAHDPAPAPATAHDPVPAHDPAPAPPPVTIPDGPPELATVTACWPAVVDVVRQDNQLLGALLADARPVSLNGDDVTLAFPASKAFSKRKAEQDDYRRVTADALRTVLGTSLALRYELRDPDESAPAGTPPAPPPGLSQEELVRRLVEEFDAQEVLDENPDPEA